MNVGWLLSRASFTSKSRTMYRRRILSRSAFSLAGLRAVCILLRKHRRLLLVGRTTVAVLVLSVQAWSQTPENQLKALSEQLSKIQTTYGDPKEALRVAQDYLALSEKTYEPDSTRVAAALRNVGESYDGLNDRPNALLAYRRALPIYEKNRAHDQGACEIQFEIARDTEDLNEALSRQATGLSCYEAVSSLGKNEIIDYRLRDTINWYGLHIDLPGVSSNSQQLIQHWLPIVQKQLGPNDILAADILYLRAQVLESQNNVEEAAANRRRAISIAIEVPSGTLLALDWLDEALNLYKLRPVDSDYMRYAVERAELRTKMYGDSDRDALANREFLVRARLDNPGVSVPASSAPLVKADDDFRAKEDEGAKLDVKAYQSGNRSDYMAAISFHEKLLKVAEERFGLFSSRVAYQLGDLGRLNRLLSSRPAEAESSLGGAIVNYERSGPAFNSCVYQAELGKLYANTISWQKNRTTEWYGNRAVEWYGRAMDCYVSLSGPTFDIEGSLFKEYMGYLTKAHPEQAAVLERQHGLRMQHAKEWQRTLSDANTARRPIPSANLDAMIKRIPAVKPETPVQKPETSSRTTKAPAQRQGARKK